MRSRSKLSSKTPELTYCTSGSTLTTVSTFGGNLDFIPISECGKGALNQFNITATSAPIVSVVSQLSLCNDDNAEDNKDNWLHRSSIRNDIFETTQSHNMPITSVINRPLCNQQQVINAVSCLNSVEATVSASATSLNITNKEKFYYNRTDTSLTSQTHANYSINVCNPSLITTTRTAHTVTNTTTIVTGTLVSCSTTNLQQISDTNYLSAGPCEIFPNSSEMVDIATANPNANGGESTQNLMKSGKYSYSIYIVNSNSESFSSM